MSPSVKYLQRALIRNLLVHSGYPLVSLLSPGVHLTEFSCVFAFKRWFFLVTPVLICRHWNVKRVDPTSSDGKPDRGTVPGLGDFGLRSCLAWLRASSSPRRGFAPCLRSRITGPPVQPQPLGRTSGAVSIPPGWSGLLQLLLCCGMLLQ